MFDDQDRHERREDYRRAMDDHEYRNGGRSGGGRQDDDEDIVEFFVKFFLIVGIIAVVGTAALYFGADFLDSTFGWNLTEWLNSVLPEMFHRD